MIVWGGTEGSYDHLDSGGIYDPGTDTWAPVAGTGAPSASSEHTAVWTGRRMVVWGGSDGYPLNSGGLYDPATDSWSPTSGGEAPTLRYLHTAIWTGRQMVVWGGTDSGVRTDTGGAYDPTTDSWAPTSMSGAPAPRADHTAVWTGRRMIVWGGYRFNSPTSISFVNSGGVYDPRNDSWAPTSTVGAPSSYWYPKAVWAGRRMLVYGGRLTVDDGGSYDPATDTWARISTVGAPSPRANHTAIWTGSRMVVWGGFEAITARPTNTGGTYDPETDRWEATSTRGAPPARYGHTAVWTRSGMIVWGGTLEEPSTLTDTGGVYDPAHDTWTPTSTTGAPSARALHQAVWTGRQMVVWGGYDGANLVNNGGVYCPCKPPFPYPPLPFSHDSRWDDPRFVAPPKNRWGRYLSWSE